MKTTSPTSPTSPFSFFFLKNNKKVKGWWYVIYIKYKIWVRGRLWGRLAILGGG